MVAGFSIAGGGVYVGPAGLPDRVEGGMRWSDSEPSAIDPSLRVDWHRPDPQGTIGYWPTYAGLRPGTRAAYLGWLSTGRQDPGVEIGIVFVYFYGLERRALVELGPGSTGPELGAIYVEVRRLLGIYGDNSSFSSYARGFCDVLQAEHWARADLTVPDWSTLGESYELPVLVRIALGRYVAAGSPIPAAWSLVWARTHPEVWFRTPGTRCAGEFDELFTHRYRARHGEGLVVRVPNRRIKVTYRPASGALRDEIVRTVGDLPDVAGLESTKDQLQALVIECTDALDAYSRYLGRHPDGRHDPAAASLLPPELLSSRGSQAVNTFFSWARARIVEEQPFVGVGDLLDQLSPGRAATAKPTKQELVAAAALLGRLGIGFEPDIRFGAKTPAATAKVLLFSTPSDAPAAPGAEYEAAALLVRLSAVVAAADDGTVSPEERRHLGHHLETSLGLDHGERARLRAHHDQLVAFPAGLTGLKARIDALPTAARADIGRFLVGIALADGVVSRDELATLAKIFTRLGIPEGDLYSAIHAAETGTELVDVGPVEVEDRASGPAPRHTIPPPPPSGDVGRRAVRLDRAKIQTRLAETADVSVLLGDIFCGDETIVAGPAATATPAGPMEPAVTVEPVAGLDDTHSALARHLADPHRRTSWTRTEVIELATTLGLPMFDAALERVNDAAVEVCGEPLIEGDDPLTVNDYARQELR